MTIPPAELRSASQTRLLTTQRRLRAFVLAALVMAGPLPSCLSQSSSLALTGLLTNFSQGQFNAIQADASGNLYLLLDQHDGIRILKTDPTATNVLAQAHLGAQGDIGLALAVDPTGNVYITGTSTSGSLPSSNGAAFTAPVGTSTTSFVAKFDSSLNSLFLTFTGSGMMSANSIAATSNAVFIAGSIFSTSLPVTPFAILQTPANGSFQNGFVEKFESTGTTLLYATYLTGAGGNTAPAALVADSAGNTYITGYTSASGYPTIAALVSNIIPSTPGTSSGFVTKLTPAGDRILFSTFIPGAGLTSIALDPIAQNLLLSGSVALGQFPVATLATIPIPTTYQVLLRMPLDGSSVLTSTLLAPGTQSFVTTAPSGTAWVAGALTLPLLPVQSLSTIGNSFAVHVNAQNVVDQAARFGGLPTSKPTFASALVNLTSLIADSAGQPSFAGAVVAQSSSSLLTTETYDLPLYNAPTAALPSSLRVSIPTPASCSGSLCPGSSAYFASLSNSSTPSLAISADAAPNLTLRNLGSASATALSITSTTFAISTNCAATLAAGAECSVALTGTPPGTLTVQAANAQTQVITIPNFISPQTPVVFSPKELDFGIQTSSSAAATRTVTITNLTAQPQTFTSKQDTTTSHILPYTLTELTSDCATSGLSTTKLLAPGATCHITLSLAASSIPANDTLLNAQWSIGTQDVLLTGYTQAAALSLSADAIDFGTQYTGSPRLPRFLYLSNSSTATQTHSLINSSTESPFAVQDHCPTQLTARTVCQLQLDYVPPPTPSNDSVTLNLDQGLHALITGQSLPQPGANGPSINPNLSVSPTSLNFPNSVVVTTASASTQTVTIGNTGANAFALALALSGDFTDTTNCPALLPGNSTCSVVVNFAPSQSGARQGLLSVTGGNSSPGYATFTGVGTPILPANNGTLNLGSIIIGQPSVQWFKVSPSFSALTAAITGTDFAAVLIEDLGYGHGQPPATAFASNISGTCFNCWLGLEFTPSSIGARAATLALTSSPSGSPYTSALAGIGLPRIGLILTPITQDFASVPVNSTSAPALFTLTNLTPAPITLTAPSTTGDFPISSAPTGGTLCIGTLPVSASCFIQVAFAPTVSGQRIGTLSLVTSAGTAAASLFGFGTADPGLSFSPTALTFKNIPDPSASHQNILFTNTGSASLQIAAPTVTLSNFIASTTCGTIAPAATCTINVAFIPANGPVTDNLQIPATISLAGNPVTTLYTIPLAGAYTTQNSGLQIVPTQVSFGPTPTGTLGLTRQFTVNNLTAGSLALDISLPHQFVLTGPACAGLAPNASCSFNVTFLPLNNGDITGSIFARANPNDGAATLNAIGYVEGYGVGSTTVAITGPISPGSLVNFGQVASGQSATQTLTLTNKGGGTSANLTIRSITTQWPFRSTTTCGSSLALNQSCAVILTYTPIKQLPIGVSPLATSDIGVLTIESDALSSPDLIDLAGSVAPALVSSPSNTAPLLSYVASQNSLTFAATKIGDISPPQSVTISNTGTSTLNLLSLQIDPDFSVKNFCDAVVPGASCNLSLYFNPRADSTQPSATKIGALEILSDSSSSLDFISLIGAASPPVLTLAPLTLNFGTVLLGHSSTLPLNVANTSANNVTFQGLTATGDYVASNGSCPASGSLLPAASSCNLQVVFAPTQTGTRTGSLSLSTSTSSLPLTASLTGIGGNSQLQIVPNQLNFGDIAVRASSILSFTLTNTGNIPVTNLVIITSSGDFANTTPCILSTLVPGASCTVTITFTPTALGTRTSTVTITSSDSTSPSTVTLTGNGVTNGTFTLTVDGGSSSTATVTSGHPANYNLTLTPLNNYIGTVVLACTPILPPDYAICSLLPSSIQLNGSAQNAVATIETIVSITQSRNKPPQGDGMSRLLGAAAICFVMPTLFFFWRKPCVRPSLLLTLATAAALVALFSANGCSHGGDPTLHYATPGTFQYQITASSTTGVQITQSVTLNLNITSR